MKKKITTEVHDEQQDKLVQRKLIEQDLIE